MSAIDELFERQDIALGRLYLFGVATPFRCLRCRELSQCSACYLGLGRRQEVIIISITQRNFGLKW